MSEISEREEEKGLEDLPLNRSLLVSIYLLRQKRKIIHIEFRNHTGRSVCRSVLGLFSWRSGNSACCMGGVESGIPSVRDVIPATI